VADGVRLAVRLTPKSSRDQIEGLAATRDGRPALAVKVRAVPEKGAANAALLRLLADALHMAPGRLSLVGGPRDRHKTVLVAGDPAILLPAMAAALGALPGVALAPGLAENRPLA
jgi:uncharacterized protein (TIGR00251 family)